MRCTPAHPRRLVLLAALMMTTSAAVSAQTGESRAKSIVSKYMTALRSLHQGATFSTDTARLQTEEIRAALGLRLPVFRVRLNTDHSRPYIVAVDPSADKVFALGGFAEINLGDVSQHISRAVSDANAVEQLARQLAVLADPNGAEKVVFPSGDSLTASAERVRKEWRRRNRDSWARDTVFRTGDDWVARVTVLSQASTSITAAWMPLQYSFIVAPDGRLLAWSYQRGQEFGGRRLGGIVSDLP